MDNLSEKSRVDGSGACAQRFYIRFSLVWVLNFEAAKLDR